MITGEVQAHIRHGYTDPTIYREAKKQEVRNRMDGKGVFNFKYKKQKDWADIEDNVFNEFDMNDYT